jgi:hypothetical protein
VGWNGSRGEWFRQLKGNIKRSVYYKGHGCQVAGGEYRRVTMDVFKDLGQRLSIEFTYSVLNLVRQVGFIWVIGGRESLKAIRVRWGSTRSGGMRGASIIPEI